MKTKILVESFNFVLALLFAIFICYNNTEIVPFNISSSCITIVNILIQIILSFYTINKIKKDLLETILDNNLINRNILNNILYSENSNFIYFLIIFVTYIIWTLFLILKIPFFLRYVDVYKISYTILSVSVILRLILNGYKSYKLRKKLI